MRNLICIIMLGFSALYITHKNEIYFTQDELSLSSTAPSFPYENLDAIKNKFIQETRRLDKPDDLITAESLNRLINNFNLRDQSSEDSTKTDLIDKFISILPISFRRHFSLVHRSYSIQQSTPTSPRVIMYGPNAEVMLTFNGGHDVDGKEQQGSDTIEMIAWNKNEKIWDFSELSFDQNNRLVKTDHPAKCIMCHSGTPKPVDMALADKYQKKLKPIFPQYPFWPGFYGSVNDIVALDAPGSKDTVMLNVDDTLKQIKGLTFADTEELFRLRKLLDTNPKYLQIVKNEMQIHKIYFPLFMRTHKNRLRYRNLVTLTDAYLDSGEEVPQALRMAPYRRTFDKEYGHYLLRPNFYLSSLMTFYQAQAVAKEIEKTSFYDQIKFSLLARKYNCGPISTGKIKLSDLDESFNLLYPNLSSQDMMSKQFLLAYQYNVTRPQDQQLPLHSWNLEVNEDIASYHYGNVYSDMNELVLWNLAVNQIPDLKISDGRSAAEERHYLFQDSDYFKVNIDRAKGFVSKMNATQYNFASSLNSYYGSTNAAFKAQPVSIICDKYLVPKAKAELQQLEALRDSKQLPQDKFKVDSRLTENAIFSIVNPLIRPGLNLAKQSCEACHNEQIKPLINVNWYSDTYFNDIHSQIPSHFRDQNKLFETKDLLLDVLSKDKLPVPFENAMPYGRKAMEPFARQCEQLIVTNSYLAPKKLSYNEIFKCDPKSATVDKTSLGCRCRSLYIVKDKLYGEFFKAE